MTHATTAEFQASSITAAPRAALTWWLWERHALVLDAFRVVAGALLLLHFACLSRTALKLLTIPGFWRVGFGPGVSANSRLSPEHWPGWCVSAVLVLTIVLATNIALGLLPRISAALLLVLHQFAMRLFFPVTDLDDIVVGGTLFWLVWLPVGKTLSFGPGRAKRATWSTLRIPGAGVTLALGQALGLQLVHPLWERFVPTYETGWWWTLLPVASAAWIAPSKVFRFIALALQIGVHTALLLQDKLIVAHGLMLSLSILLWGETPPLERQKPLPIPIDFATAVVALQALLVIGYTFAALAGQSALQQMTGKVLQDLGTSAIASGRRAVDMGTRVYVTETREVTGTKLYAYAGDDLRSRMLLSYLADADARPATRIGNDLARALARRYCKLASSPKRPSYLHIGNSNSQRPVFQFKCEASKGEVLARSVSDSAT
jgi:hypothetical protein